MKLIIEALTEKGQKAILDEMPKTRLEKIQAHIFKTKFELKENKLTITKDFKTEEQETTFLIYTIGLLEQHECKKDIDFKLSGESSITKEAIQ